jgi:DNA repair ATPase RecN
LNGEKFFFFRANKDLLNYASRKIEELRNEEDKEDALQESWLSLLESNIETIEDAKKLFNRTISRIGMASQAYSKRTNIQNIRESDNVYFKIEKDEYEIETSDDRNYTRADFPIREKAFT